jgi:hypothetical protein
MKAINHSTPVHKEANASAALLDERKNRKH